MEKSKDRNWVTCHNLPQMVLHFAFPSIDSLSKDYVQASYTAVEDNSPKAYLGRQIAGLDRNEVVGTCYTIVSLTYFVSAA